MYVGQNGRDILNTWTLTLAETDKINVLFEKHGAYCNPKQNVIIVRYKFNTRNQSDGETIDQYVTELKRLAKDFAYGELTSEMIRDRIVSRKNNPPAKEKLLQADVLDLGKALAIARGIEISTTQMKHLTERYKSVHGMRKSRYDRNQARTEQPRDDKTRVSECRNCGRKQETKQKCPARGKVCFKCKKPNHYSRMCRSEGVHDLQQEVNEPELEDNDFFIGAINHEGGNELLVNLVIEDSHTVKVKLDMGAQVNVMPLALYKALGKDPKKSSLPIQI